MDSSIFKKAGELLSRKSKYRHWQAVVAVLGVAVIGTTAIVLSQPAQTMTKETFCGMEEHVHTDECYERVLICGLEEEGLVEVEENGTSSGEAGQPSEAGESPAETLQPTPEATQAPEKEPHQHDDSCYEEYLVLDCQEAEAPIHQLGCYAGAEMLICGQEESADHIHTDECYNAVPVMALACGQEESDTHTHSEDGEDSCYIVVGAKKLICGMEESGEHTHTEGCYELIPAENFQCMEGHIHTESCYPQETEPTLICGLEEQEAHSHTDECYTVTRKEELICGQEASEEHEHTAECYQTAEEKELTCGREETEGHTHTEQCYSQSEEKTPICGREEKEVPPADAHVHTIACCRTERRLICGKEEYIPEETEEPASEETAESTETPEASAEPEATPEGSTQPKATAEASAQPEAAPENSAVPDADTQPEATPESSTAPESEGKHVHTDACYEMRLVCGLEEHTHTDDCYKEAYCGIPAHVHMPGCYDEEGNVICGKEEHIHEGNCYKEPHCGITAHTHTEECYDENGELICGLEEHTHGDECFVEEDTYTGPFHCQERIHQHTADCYDEENNLICGMADYVIHTHTEACYDEDGQLICPLPEIEEHAHSAQCYDIPGEGEEAVLTCGKEEAKLHTHTEECYDEEGNLTCGMLQTEEHVHSEACLKETEKAHIHTANCYDGMGNLICGYKEAHTHTEECYDEEGNLICGFEEEAEELPYYCAEYVHRHSEECYDENQNLICGKADFVAHVHTEDCYNKAGELVCPLPEIEAHTHTAACYSEANGQLEAELICGKTEDIKLHTHTEECYDVDGKLICGKLEVLEHVHSDACHVKPEAVEKITYYCQEMVHEHTEDCYNENGELICGKADYVVHTHTEKCYGADGKLICPLPEVEVHTHTEVCYDENGQLICGKEEVQLHTHTEECYDENGALICGQTEVLEHIHSKECEVSHKPITKTFQGENFVVTATYKPEANIPEEAELIAEQITAESNEEHYAKRQAEYQEALGDDKATMRALLKIGFYVNGEEVEPESPVTITVQFLNENGLAEGKPITVIHFADEGTELLEGSKVEDGSTTFEMNSFSEIAVGYGVENVKVPLDEAIDYDTDAFHITFRIKGNVRLSAEEIVDGVTFAPEEGDAKPETDSAESAGSDSQDDPVEESLPSESGATEPGEKAGTVSGTTTANGQHITGETEGDTFTASVESEFLEKDFEFRVESLDEESEEYAAMVAYGEEIGDGGQELLLQVWSYSLNYDSEEVVLSDCTVTAEITPTQALVDAVNDAAVMAIEEPMMIDAYMGNSVPEAMDAPGEETVENQGDWTTDEEEQQQNGLTIAVMGLSKDAEIDEIETTDIDGDIVVEEMEPIVVTLKAGFFAARATGTPNPKFKVQYYANLDIVAYDDDTLKEKVDEKGRTNELPVINTAEGKLPENGKGTEVSPNKNGIRNLYVNTGTGKLKTKPQLTKVYETRPFEYHKAPTINYFNALVENGNYELKEVWILKEGKDENSIDKNDWDIHSYDENLHFTNRELSGGTTTDGTYIYIAENAVIRLVYDTTKKDKDFMAAFYDYDIGDGKIYTNQTNAQNGTNGQNTSTQGSNIRYMRTGQQGINALGNYTGVGSRFAFGNANTGSGFQHEQWNGNLLNKFNGTQGGHPTVKGSYKGCTFGLASKLVDGKIQYASNVNVPNLFNEGVATGKTSYENNEYSLKFSRNGDTHTLIAVNGTGATGLDSFNHPSPNNSTHHTHIWTNNFWPMDSAPSFGSDGHDMKFGNYVNRENYKFAGQAGAEGGSAAANGTFPWSDDGIDHNSYFGMHYTVEFDLVADYAGPLEYYFFGDDDMWVFLSGGSTTNTQGKLVCDIGGVHSSVGEYLNLWDYINKETEKIHRHTEACYKVEEGEKVLKCGYVDSKKFTLDFFYTERGESGSTCWMQFTLPSVSSVTPETTDKDFGHLKIRKDVKVIKDGKEYPARDLFKDTEQAKFFKEKEFEFTLTLKGPNGVNLKDDYAYIRYDRDGNAVTDGSGILQWETIADGEKFKLKDGEYISIQFLPTGTTYTIEEDGDTVIGGVVYTGTEVEGDGEADKDNKLKVTGTIESEKIKNVGYINIYSAFKLPETGGSGTTPYTVAGTTIVLLGGAGLMYRKKFRERRG